MPHLHIELKEAEINQLRSYIEQAEQDGWYYGNEAYFRKRHERIKKAFGMTEQKEGATHD